MSHIPIGNEKVELVEEKRNMTILPAYTAHEEGTQCSETSAYNIQTPGNRLKERTQHDYNSRRGVKIHETSLQIYSVHLASELMAEEAIMTCSKLFKLLRIRGGYVLFHASKQN